MPPFTRPETVLRRCEELLAVGQPQAALAAISEVFSSKRFRTTPLSSLEPIMLKFLELCVQLKKGRHAKEGLHMYKNVAQNTSVASVETVVTAFITRSKAKLDEALKKVDELVPPTAAAEGATASDEDKKAAMDVEDLDASETPESILLSAVSDEGNRERTYRTIVMPWLRFLWEAYRNALDTLRNNVRLELLYQQIAHDAFAFCLQHQRKTEFRRLCDNLRMHLQGSQKYANQAHSINLSDPDTLQRHLDTRFQQLNTAVELELWQEAFRTAEDIHGLVAMSKRAPKASMMAAYYEKLVKVFAVGNNFLFHAAAYGKWHASQAAATSTEEDRKGAALVLLSALAVPVGTPYGSVRRDGVQIEDSEAAKGKILRLAALLGLPAPPSRASLLRDALRRDILSRVTPELRNLYNMLEVDFHPLSITSRIDPLLSELEADPETARYVEPIKTVVLARLFQQLGQVYDALDLERAVRLATFAGEAKADSQAARSRVERFVADACRRGDLDVTLDHAGATIKFDQDLFGAADATNVAVSGAGKGSTGDAQLLQPSPATLLRTQLARLAECLHAAAESVKLDGLTPRERAVEAHRAALAAMAANLPNERKALLARRKIIETRRKAAEEASARKEKEEAQARALRQAKAVEEAAKAEKEAQRQRDLRRIEQERAAAKAADTKKTLAALVEKSGGKIDAARLATKAQKAGKNVEELDQEQVVDLVVKQVEKDKKSKEERLEGINKRMDHLERAFREEERPLLVLDYQRQQTDDRAQHESLHEQANREGRDGHQRNLDLKQRLQPLLPHYQSYRQRVQAAADKKNADAQQQSAAKIATEKAKLRERVLAQRETDRIAREAREAEEREIERRLVAERLERERIEAERIAALAAEEETKAAAEAERKAKAEAERAEREEQRKKDAELLALRLKREEEAEARRKGGLPKEATPASTPAGRPVVGSDKWRRENPPATAEPGRPSPTGTPTSAAGGPPKILGSGGAIPGWRLRQMEKEAAAAAGGVASPSPASTPEVSRPTSATERVASQSGGSIGFVNNAKGEERTWRPAGRDSPLANATNKKDDDEGFQTVAPKAKTGRYIPPSQRNR